jgi:putative phosphoribosyl transferase
VAHALGAPLGVVVARKVRCPGAPELAMGAIAVWGPHLAEVRIPHVLAGAGVDEAGFARARDAELPIAQKRAAEWLSDGIDLADRPVVVVDDGLATGATMRAALKVLHLAGATTLIAAVPIGAPGEVSSLEAEVVCLHAPSRFGSVGAHYADFGQVDDATVTTELARARRRG